MTTVDRTKLTKWEVGNELVRLANIAGLVSRELRDYPEIRDEVQKIRREITRIYNQNGMLEEMGFGI